MSETTDRPPDPRTHRGEPTPPPDLEAFPCLRLAYEAGRAGETAPAWLNAANEVAVAAFLDELIPWTAIADVLNEALDLHDGTPATSVDVVIETDRRAREVTRKVVERIHG